MNARSTPPTHEPHSPQLAPGAARRSARGPVLFVGTVAAVMGTLFAVGLVPRLRQRAELVAEAREAAEERPTVRVVRPRAATNCGALVLPGSVEAIQEVPLHARSNGYLRSRLVDIGDLVKAGQLLAEIDTPELDQELAQAEASLGQARAARSQAVATEALARATTARYDKMAEASVASVQEFEEKRAAAAVAVANVASSEAAVRNGEANLARLRELKRFSHLTAPFAGRITERTTEVGALIAAGQGQPLYRLARTDPVRIFVHVPQVDAPSVVVGKEARFEARGLPGRSFTGKVTRTAGAVDVATRTMLTEMQIENGDGALLPGMYGQVSLPCGREGGALLVPASALVFAAQGTQLLVVGAQGRVHAARVRIEADYGTELAISEGISLDDRLIVDPGERTVEGSQVVVQVEPRPSASAATAHDRSGASAAPSSSAR